MEEERTKTILSNTDGCKIPDEETQLGRREDKIKRVKYSRDLGYLTPLGE